MSNAPAASLAGKVALVTGAATGIGEAIAAALATAGATVVVNHNHTPGPADKVVEGISQAGATATAIGADVSSGSEYAAMVEHMLAEFGHWDILVNNAAVAITKPFPEITEAEFDLSYAVNVKGRIPRPEAGLGSPGRPRADHHNLQLHHRADAARVRGV